MDTQSTEAALWYAQHRGWRVLWPEGQRNDRVARAAGYLLSHGLDPCVTLELIAYTNQSCGRPPLEHEEAARTVMSIWSREQKLREAAAGGYHGQR